MKEKEYIAVTGVEWDTSRTSYRGYGNTRTMSYDANLCDRRTILTEKEREYIKNIIEPFRYKVAGVRKLNQSTEYVLQILYNQKYTHINGGIWRYDAVWLPPFSKKEKAFSNLEPDKIYPLDFLCL